MKPILSIIIPTLDEEKHLPALFGSLASLLPSSEVIVVDGGSRDRTPLIVEEFSRSYPSVRLLRGSGGRGGQIARGATVAEGDLLLFLHADSAASPAMIGELRRIASLPPISRRSYAVTQFRLRFDRDRPILRLSAFLARIDSVWTSFGDQGILVGRDLYEEIGPIRPDPLFEDVDFLRRARRFIGVRKSNAVITTSSRRFLLLGPLRTQILNSFYLLSWLLGGDPVRLARNYRAALDVASRREIDPHCGGRRFDALRRKPQRNIQNHGEVSDEEDYHNIFRRTPHGRIDRSRLL